MDNVTASTISNSFSDFVGNEREPLLRRVTAEARQYTSIEPTGTFFTPMDSPDHSDREDEVARRPGISRSLPKPNELFGSRALVKPTLEMVSVLA